MCVMVVLWHKLQPHDDAIAVPWICAIPFLDECTISVSNLCVCDMHMRV